MKEVRQGFLWLSSFETPIRRSSAVAAGRHRGKLMALGEQFRRQWKWPLLCTEGSCTCSGEGGTHDPGISTTSGVGLPKGRQQQSLGSPGELSFVAEAERPGPVSEDTSCNSASWPVFALPRSLEPCQWSQQSTRLIFSCPDTVGTGGTVAWGKISWFFSWGFQFTIYCHFH